MATAHPGATEVDQKDIDEARAFHAQLEAQLKTMPAPDTVPVEVTRRARREGKGIFPAPVFLEEAIDLEVPGRSGPIKVRVIKPDRQPTGIYLHIHGGGWPLGAHDMQDAGFNLPTNQPRLCPSLTHHR